MLDHLRSLSFGGIKSREDIKFFKKQLDISKYKLSAFDIKKSVIKIMLNYNWEIIEQVKNIIIGQLPSRKGGEKVKVTINAARVTIEEIPSNSEFDENWIRFLSRGIVKEIKYYHHVNIAQKIIGH